MKLKSLTKIGLLLVLAFQAHFAQSSVVYDLEIDVPGGTTTDYFFNNLTLQGSCSAVSGDDLNSCIINGTPTGGGSDPTDWFKWVAKSDGTLTVNALFSHADADLDIGLFDALPDEWSDHITKSDSSTDNETLTSLVTTGTTYWLLAYSVSDSDLNNPAYSADIYESNNSASTATHITAPATLALMALGLFGLGFTNRKS